MFESRTEVFAIKVQEPNPEGEPVEVNIKTKVRVTELKKRFQNETPLFATARKTSVNMSVFCPLCGSKTEDHSLEICPCCGKEICPQCRERHKSGQGPPAGKGKRRSKHG